LGAAVLLGVDRLGQDRSYVSNHLADLLLDQAFGLGADGGLVAHVLLDGDQTFFQRGILR